MDDQRTKRRRWRIVLLTLPLPPLAASIAIAAVRLGPLVAASACRKPLRVWSRAVLMYAADYGESLPPVVAAPFVSDRARSPDSWDALVRPYLPAAVPRCPSVAPAGRLAQHAGSVHSAGYAINGYLSAAVDGESGDVAYRGRSLAEVPDAARVAMLFDCRVGIRSRRGPDVGRTAGTIRGIFSVDFVDEIAAMPEGATRHLGGANYAFVDGHVTWLPPERLDAQRLGARDGARFSLISVP